MRKKWHVPERLVWEEVVKKLPSEIREILQRLDVTYLDHTDSRLVLICNTDERADVVSDNMAFVAQAIAKLSYAFTDMLHVNSVDEWALMPEFYKGRQWRLCRYATLLQQGNWCRCCGGRPPNVELHVDHIVPRSVDPSKALDMSNLQVLCRDCNMGKGNGDTRDWRGYYEGTQ